MIRTSKSRLGEEKTLEAIREAMSLSNVTIVFIYGADREELPTDINRFVMDSEEVLRKIARREPITHDWCEDHDIQ